jgi:hypothetical protein
MFPFQTTDLAGTPSISEYQDSISSSVSHDRMLSEANPDRKSLVSFPAISASSVVHRGSDEDIQRSRRPTNRFANKVSPHLVLGEIYLSFDHTILEF